MFFTYLAGNVKAAAYLQIPFVPGAGELTVFCAALLGAGFDAALALAGRSGLIAALLVLVVALVLVLVRVLIMVLALVLVFVLIAVLVLTTTRRIIVAWIWHNVV